PACGWRLFWILSERGRNRDTLSSSHSRIPIDRTVVRSLFESVDMADALHPQTLLAYAMNGEALPPDYGAPLRVRVARHLGWKNTKYLSRIVVTDRRDYYRKKKGTWYGGI